MTFKVATGDSEGRATHWFASFLADNWTGTLQEQLNRNNARASLSEFTNIGDPIIFESEQDYLIFLLKWS